MLYPTINELTKGEFNRYELSLATAKCARLITNEYVTQRENAERSMTGNKETDKPLNTLIDREVRDEKAVKIAIGRIYNGEYKMIRHTADELCETESVEETEEEAENVAEQPIAENTEEI